MSARNEESIPDAPGDIHTPNEDVAREAAGEAGVDRGQRQDEGEEMDDEVFEDASDAGEVLLRRRDVLPPPPPPKWNYRRPIPLPVSNTPHIKPEDYDGTRDWEEYKIYYDQYSELYGWDEERKAMVLGICLKGEARVVLASLSPAQRRSYLALTNALAQSFSPKEMVHLYQAELKARRRKPDESMVDLGRDIAKLVRLAYPTADPSTRDVIGINSFLEALPGPASEMKLHVIKGRPRNLQEAVAHATEVDAVMEAESRKSSRKRGDVRMVESVETDLVEEIKKLKSDLTKTQEELASARRGMVEKRREKRSLRDVTCYECGEKGHVRRNCPKPAPKSQGNESRRLEKQ